LAVLTAILDDVHPDVEVERFLSSYIPARREGSWPGDFGH
jgi:hypothetical protein